MWRVGSLPAFRRKRQPVLREKRRTCLENGRQVLRLDRIEAGWVR